MANVPRSFTSGGFSLTLDGVDCGMLKSVEGGGVYADVVTEPMGAEGFTKKHVGRARYEELVLSFGLAMADALYDWIAGTLSRKVERKDGSVVQLDFNLKPTGERRFFNALITALTIPALDASSKEAAYMTLKLAPEYTRTGKGGGQARGKTSAQKQFVASNFRLDLDGLDCTKVMRIDSFTITQTIAESEIGDRRDRTREPAALEFPNLRVTLAAGGAQTWESWFDDFVLEGNNGDDREKSGAIVFLSANRAEELGRVTLRNVGIFSLRQVAPSGDQVARVVAELYCERMELTIGGAKPAPAEPVLTGARLPDPETPPG